MTAENSIIAGVDFKGQRLCTNCWDGHHYIHETTGAGKRGKKLPNCLGGRCECDCSQLLTDGPRLNREAKERQKAEREAQQPLCEKPSLSFVNESEKKESAVGL